ncbi:hypothetical protein BCR32DRAFT_292032 [Anaeromyces robustus]|uniref:Carbohydrate binding module family 10 domain-containing protein n=1 Tax=Anaeromyces robustus TaxID=1754192 RepID=A0A1Y1XCB3_9FUNG|nr:hypothetical protein BCR32DRAFT_292032 [Anaeromyces robustus]|eukprot:ORX83357.1 hypothetical protein BCR32DRAFT_292032 [Anaeromyces robustus]
MKYILGLLLVLLVNNIEASTPKCSDCTVYATGKDGTSWGWENDSFCKLPSKCYSTTTKKSSIVKTKSTYINKKTTTSTKDSDKSTTQKVTTSNKTTVVTSNKSTTIKISTTTDKNETTTNVSSTTVTSTVASPMQTDANGKLICNECNVESTGGDGSLWGFENEKSCIVDATKCNIKTDTTNQAANNTTTTTKQERGKDGILICSTCEYTRIDDDTTTWNTENGEDCRVIGSRCGFNKTPHPWCSGCVVTATGEDGALYGWESQASCLINEIDCGFVDKKNNSHVETESSAIAERYVNLYYVIATLLTLFIVRGF